MSATDLLAVLRQRNKDLLSQLKQQRDKLVQLSHKREREDGAEGRSDPAEILILTDVDRRPARAALAKPTVRFADTCAGRAGIKSTSPTPSSTFTDRGGSAGLKTPSDTFKDTCRHLQGHNGLQDTRPVLTKSVPVNHNKEKDGEVTFHADEHEATSSSTRHHLQPLLGYDWIAGVLDAEDSLIERSDEFFNDLRMFRNIHKNECVSIPQAEMFEQDQSGLPRITQTDSANTCMDSHQCTFSYRINSRLFPVPLHSQECCPVCKQQKSTHPHTAAKPAHIRVSIPRSTLVPSYKYKPHRRCSFDPSDSLGLPSHCLSGWSNKGQSTVPPATSLDLRSSLKMKYSQCDELEDVPAAKISGDQISEVSRLPRHNFEHFSPRRKPRSSSVVET